MIALLRRKFVNLVSDDRFSEILSGSALALFARIIATGISIITSIFVARVYGAETTGILALVYSFVILATVITVLGTNTSILRLIPEHIKKYSVASAFLVYKKSQYIVVVVSAIVGLLLFYQADWIANTVFSKPQLTNVFALAALFIAAKSIMDLNTNAVRGLSMARVFALMNLLPDLSKLIIILSATYLYFDRNIPVYSLFASWLITAITGIIIMQFAFKKRLDANNLIEDIPVRSLLSLSLPMLMTTSMAFVIGKSGIIILGIFHPESEVGYYSIAASLATLTTFALQAITSVSAPKFSELYHSNQMDELFYIARKSTKLIFWITAPLLLCLIIFGKPLISLLYGQDFSVAYPALVLLSLGQFVNSISGSTGMFMSMTGHHIALRNIMIGAALINVALNLLLTPAYGMIGAALAGMTSIAFWNIYTLVFIKRKYGQSLGYLPKFKSVL